MASSLRAAIDRPIARALDPPRLALSPSPLAGAGPPPIPTTAQQEPQPPQTALQMQRHTSALDAVPTARLARAAAALLNTTAARNDALGARLGQRPPPYTLGAV